MSSQPASPQSIELRWEDFNPKLIKLRVKKRSKEIRDRFKNLADLINSPSNPEPAFASCQILEMLMSETEELVSETYRICRDVAKDLCRKGPGFARLAHEHELVPLMNTMESEMRDECHRRCTRPNQLAERLQLLLVYVQTPMEELRANWNETIETDEAEFEHAHQIESISELQTPEKTANNRESFFHPLNDYRIIHDNGEPRHLTKQQAAIFKCIDEARMRGIPQVSKGVIQKQINCSRIYDSFRSGDGPKIWGKLIVPAGRRSDMYELKLRVTKAPNKQRSKPKDGLPVPLLPLGPVTIPRLSIYPQNRLLDVLERCWSNFSQT